MKNDIKEVKLPSGAILKITHTPFAESWALNEVIMEELKVIHFDTQLEMLELLKNLFCSALSSPKIKKALWKCFERCTYDSGSGSGDLKIDQDTFEPNEARQDYVNVCMEVAKYNIGPFAKAHSADYSQILEALKSSLDSKPKSNPS